MPAKILYVVHSSGLGGALLSLDYFLARLDRARYEPVVACTHDVPEVLATFRSQGVAAFFWPGISIFSHNTPGGWYSLLNPIGLLGLAQAVHGFRASIDATRRLIDKVGPDIVHLNTQGLVASALGAKQIKVPLVWHFRESVHQGHLGLRRRWLRHLVTCTADDVIFICEQNQLQLMGTRYGTLVYELVDFSRFDRRLDGLAVRRELGLSPTDKVVLFLGGTSYAKGALVLLASLSAAKRQVSNLHVIIAGAIRPKSSSLTARVARALLPLVGSGTERQRFEGLLRRGHLEEFVHLLPFRRDPERLMAAADVLVSPFTQPHFAMTLAEAGAMGKPVIASRIGGLEEAVVEGETGLLVPPNDPGALGDAIVRVLTDEPLARRLGEGGYRQSVEKFDVETNAKAIMAVYDRLLTRPA